MKTQTIDYITGTLCFVTALIQTFTGIPLFSLIIMWLFVIIIWLYIIRMAIIGKSGGVRK